MSKKSDPPNKNKTNVISKKGKLLLFFFALFVHLAAVLPFLNMPIALDDMYQYDMLGRSLSSGLGYRWYSKADVEILEPYLKSYLPLDETTFPERRDQDCFPSAGLPVLPCIFLQL